MSHPFWRLDLHVTEACNLACPYCYAGQRGGEDLPPDDARRAIDWLMRCDKEKVHITFWGGEPLLRIEQLERITGEARQRARDNNKHLSLSMPTNATLIDDRALRWIEANRVRIFLSIDGDEQTQAGRPTAAGRSSHAMAAAGMRRVLAHRLAHPPAVRMTVTPQNASRVVDNVAYFAARGVAELLIYPAIDNAWTDTALEEFGAAERRLARWLIERLASAPPTVAARRAGPSLPGVPLLKAWRPLLRRMYEAANTPDDAVARRPHQGPLRHCGVGQQLVALSVDGSFAPCHRFAFYGREGEGALQLGDLDRGVDSARAAPFGELMVEQLRPRGGGERCVDCEVYDLCTFRCLAINFATTGDLATVPRRGCALMRAQIAACREVIAAAGADPRLALYLGLPVSSALRAAGRSLGRRAWMLYQKRGGVG